MNRLFKRIGATPGSRAFILGCVLAFSASIGSAAILLEIDGIQGDVSHRGFTGQIACDSFAFEVNRDLSESVRSGTADVTLGVGELGCVTLKKRLDSTSAFILRKGISGSSIGSARIRCFAEPARSRALPYLLINLDVAFIKSWVTSAGANRLPTEEIQIFYNKISFQNAPTLDGLSPSIGENMAWDRVESKPWNPVPLLLQGFANLPPVAGADAVTRNAGGSIKIPLATLTGNDSDPEGDAFSVTAVASSGAAGADVSLAGNWVYFTSPGTVPDYFDYTVEDEYGAISTGRVNVLVAGPEQRLELAAAIEHVPGRADVFRLSFNGIPGLRYRVLYTTDFSVEPVWELLGYVNAADNGLVNYVDEAATSGRLYRVIYP